MTTFSNVPISVSKSEKKINLFLSKLLKPWNVEINQTSKRASNNQMARKKLVDVVIKLSKQWNNEQFQVKLCHILIWKVLGFKERISSRKSSSFSVTAFHAMKIWKSSKRFMKQDGWRNFRFTMEPIQAMKHWNISNCFFEQINLRKKSEVFLENLLGQGNFEKIHVVS